MTIRNLLGILFNLFTSQNICLKQQWAKEALSKKCHSIARFVTQGQNQGGHNLSI